MNVNMLEGLSDNIEIDKDKCTFCGKCVDTCILDNLRMKLAPCRQACPLGTNCQGYVQLIARGEEEKALEMVRRTLPFPGILGRICDHPCETACTRNETDGEGVAIRSLKRYLADRFKNQEMPLPDMKPNSGRNVAVVGSGPAGMMAAYDLRCKGHLVTVMESESAPGGMLRWSIPDFRLPLAVLESELGLLERMGVKFECNVKIGEDMSLGQLQDEYDAVILATGRPDHLTLNNDNEHRPGIYHGLPLLKAVRNGEKPVMGKTVLVIGGGNVAIDAAQTARRLGAETVKMVSLESRSELPAFPEAIEEALAEGVTLECSWGNLDMVFENDQLKGATFQSCTNVFDPAGNFSPSFDAGNTQFLETNNIIIAIGQQMDETIFAATDLSKSSVSDVNGLTLQTSVENVFVAGDLYTGPSSVIGSMAGGRESAESVDRLFIGDPIEYNRSYEGPVVTEFEIDREQGSSDSRIAVPKQTFKGAGDFGEILGVLDQDSARKEAQRCHSCGQPFGKHRTCWFCLPCEVECPNEAIHVNIPYLLR